MRALLRLLLASTVLVITTLLLFIPLAALGWLKILPLPMLRRRVRQAMGALLSGWISANNAWLHRSHAARWHIAGLENLPPATTGCLVVSNHQSWVDILILQGVLNRRLPPLRFFMKRELLWLPLVGVSCWALDFLLMKRHSREFLARHPERRGEDLATARHACQRLRGVPVAIVCFAEGTRFSAAKHHAQQSPYAHLLRPKAGGMALVLDALADDISTVIDVTLHYPEGQPRFIDLLAGRVQRVNVDIRCRPCPALAAARYSDDEHCRTAFQQWANQLWVEKDARLAQFTALSTPLQGDNPTGTRPNADHSHK